MKFSKYLKAACCCLLFTLALVMGCKDGISPPLPEERCSKPPHRRVDAHTPESVVPDWGQPVRLGSPINTPCPEDAIEISRDGQYLYFYGTKDLFENLPANEIFSSVNGTYKATRTASPVDFSEPIFYDLGKGIDQSLDGELSFTPDGQKVYFHSNRSTNTGYRQNPPVDDFLDIYVADIIGGEPGPGRNLGPPVNSIYPDGEHAIHPDGVSLYFASTRPSGTGEEDIWISIRNGSSWSNPANLGAPINSNRKDYQPTFTADGNTMYFASERDLNVGIAIYRSQRNGDTWGRPELVIKGIVGEPSLTADGKSLYFVHVLTDANGIFDADIWYSAWVP
jgi:hypothetical protein